jgi:uncharacterized membrane protein
LNILVTHWGAIFRYLFSCPPLKIGRCQWIDAWRGAAVVGMIAYHVLYFVDYHELQEFKTNQTLWIIIFKKFIACQFFFISGLMVRSIKRRSFLNYLKKEFPLLSYSLWITLSSWWLFNENKIVLFGILHSLSLCHFLSWLIPKNRWIHLFIGFSILYLYFFERGPEYNNLYEWIGLGDRTSPTFDIMPIFPWFGFYFIGCYTSTFLNTTLLSYISSVFLMRKLEWIGQRSLLIYMLHVPVIHLSILTYKEMVIVGK